MEIELAIGGVEMAVKRAITEHFLPYVWDHYHVEKLPEEDLSCNYVWYLARKKTELWSDGTCFDPQQCWMEFVKLIEK